MNNNNLNSSNNSNMQIVLWGTNLTSNVGYPRFNKVINNMVELPFFIKSIIYGLLLSDGWINYSSKSINARLGLKQSFKNLPYLWSVFNTLSHYCSSLPHPLKGKKNNTITYSVQFLTRSLPCFTKLHSSWYNKGIKIIPNDIYDYLTPVALAQWIMGDGAVHPSGLELCTDSFSNQEVAKLINVLIIRYQLNCTMIRYNSGGPRIYIKADSMATLRAIVAPHIHPFFNYKIHL